MKNEINLDYLYLDLSVCTRCQGSNTNLEDSVEELKKKHPNYAFNLRKVHVNSQELAEILKFESSPTIRVNGQDLPIEFKENNCDSCGDFCGDSVDCRIWVYEGKEFESAPQEMIVGLVSKYINGELTLKELDPNYKVSQNIIDFFKARAKKEAKETEVETIELGSSCCGDKSSCCG